MNKNIIVEYYQVNNKWIKVPFINNFGHLRDLYTKCNIFGIRTKYRINKIIFIIFHK